MNGVTFGLKHSFRDFGIVLSSKKIGMPRPKTETVNVPGMDGLLDLTETLGDVRFENRSLSFTFTVYENPAVYLTTLSQIQNYLHGKVMRVVLDEDRGWYYYGRCTVNEYASNRALGTIVIDVDANPYKKEVNASGTSWVWDTFSFVDGVISRTIYNLTAEYQEDNIYNRGVPGKVTVTVGVTSDAELQFPDTSEVYHVSTGLTVLSVTLNSGENTIRYKGVDAGTMTLVYEGRSL